MEAAPITLYVDKGFESEDMATWERDEGIKLRVVPTEQHQTNGRVEVENRIIQDRMRAMLKGASLPKTYWPRLLNEYCRNRNNIARQGKRATPYESFTGTRKGPMQTRKVALGELAITPKVASDRKGAHRLECEGKQVRVVGFDDSLYIVIDPEAKTPKPETKVPNDVRPCPKQIEYPASPEPEVEQQTEPREPTEVLGEPVIEMAGIALDQSKHKNLRHAILEGVQKKLSGRKDDGKKWKGTKKMAISAVRKTELKEADDVYREEEQRLLREAFVEGADL